MRKAFLAIPILGCFLVLGAGCSWLNKAKNVPVNALTAISPSGPKPADLKGASPAQAAKKINFVPGSRIELRQTIGGKDSNQARIITIEKFAPMVYAKFSWKMDQKSEGQPVTGGLDDMSLNSNHYLYPPAYWPPERVLASETSGIWLSNEVYEELTKTKEATLYYDFTDKMLYGQMAESNIFSDAVKDLKISVDVISKTKDPDLTDVTATGTYQLKVNGQQTTVQVIQAKNWYGEITVLDNPQNPLILKLSFDPGQEAVNAKNSILSSLLGYEVTSLDGVQ